MSVKRFAKSAILNLRLLSIKQAFLPTSAVILYYHSVSNHRNKQAPYINPSITVTDATFRKHLELLRKRFSFVSLSDLYNWHNGQEAIPPRSIAITFDDGFADNYHIAAPLLEEYGTRGTFYLTASAVENQSLPEFCKITWLFEKGHELGRTLHLPDENKTWNLANYSEKREAFVYFMYPSAKMSAEDQARCVQRLENLLDIRYNADDAPKMMTWEQAKELHGRGHIIGNHTFSHPNVGHLTPELQRFELEESKKIMQERLGFLIEHFSYPHPCLNPHRNENSDAIVRELGYKTCVLTDWGKVEKTTSPLLLPRISMGEMSVDDFTWKLETAFAGIKV